MRLFGYYNYPFINPYTLAKKEHELSFPQKNFVRKYINKVDVTSPFNTSLIQTFPADVWIVGSDQVWRPWCAPNILNNFFDFIEEDSIIKRIAYAASFGTDTWEISAQMTDKIKPLIKRFSGVSVRELSGVRMCTEYLDTHAECVLDPTLLLTPEQYLSLTKPNDAPTGEYIATYVLDVNKDKRKILKSISKEKCLPILEVGKMHRNRFDSVESWIAGIANAKCVITDSFHGTVFSLIFDKPVNIMKNDLRGNSRLDSLINLLGLKADGDGFFRINNKNRLNQLRMYSIKYLEEVLSE